MSTLTGLVRIRHVIFWHPSVWHKITKTQSGCKFGEKCVFMDREVDSQPNKKPKKRVVVKVPLLCSRIPGNLVAYSRM